MEALREEAILTAITIENRSLCFYRAVSSKVNDSTTRRIFELLSKEESEHLDHLYTLYQGDRQKLESILNDRCVYQDPYYCSLIDSIDSNTLEKDALEIALKEEQACIRSYSSFVESIREPHTRDIFSRILNETRNHCEMIEGEYMRHMKMVDSSDQDIYVRE